MQKKKKGKPSAVELLIKGQKPVGNATLEYALHQENSARQAMTNLKVDLLGVELYISSKQRVIEALQQAFNTLKVVCNILDQRLETQAHKNYWIRFETEIGTKTIHYQPIYTYHIVLARRKADKKLLAFVWATRVR
jgi:hypothetical protein